MKVDKALPDERTAALEQRWQALRERLIANRASLERQGTLVKKVVNGNDYTVLRYAVKFKGRRIWRTVHVGPTGAVELTRRVRNLLAEFRLSAAARQEMQSMVRIARTISAAVRRQARRRAAGRRVEVDAIGDKSVS